MNKKLLMLLPLLVLIVAIVPVAYAQLNGTEIDNSTKTIDKNIIIDNSTSIKVIKEPIPKESENKIEPYREDFSHIGNDIGNVKQQFREATSYTKVFEPVNGDPDNPFDDVYVSVIGLPPFIENDSGVFVPFITKEDTKNVIVEGGNVSFLVNKETCTAKIYNPGKVDNTVVPTLSDVNYILREAVNGTDNWGVSAINAELCDVTVDGSGKIVTVQTDGINVKEITYQYLPNEGLETFLKYTNNEKTGIKYGFTESITNTETKQDSEKLDGVVQDVGILEINGVTYDYKNDPAFWAVNVDGDNTSIDFMNAKNELGIGESLIVDPLYKFNTNVVNDGEILDENSAACDVTLGTPLIVDISATTLSFGAVHTGNAYDCVRAWIQWNISDFKYKDVSKLQFNFQITSKGSGAGPNSDVTPVTNNTATIPGCPSSCSSTLYDALWADIGDGTPYISNDSDFNVVGTYTKDLGSTALADFNSQVDDGYFTIGLKHTDESSQADNFAEAMKSSTGTPPTLPTLIVTYTLPLPTAPVVGITVDDPTSKTVETSTNSTTSVGDILGYYWNRLHTNSTYTTNCNEPFSGSCGGLLSRFTFDGPATGKSDIVIGNVTGIVDQSISTPLLYYDFSDAETPVYDQTFNFTTPDTVNALAVTSGYDRIGVKLQTSHSGIGNEILCAEFYGQKTGSPSGSIWFKVYQGETEVATSNSVTATLFSTTLGWQQPICLTSPYTVTADDIFVFETDGGNYPTNAITLGANNNGGQGNPTPTNTERCGSNGGSFSCITTESSLLRFDYVIKHNNRGSGGTTYDGINNGATIGVTGIRDEAYDFDGTNDHIDTNISVNVFDTTVSFSMSAWINPDTSQTSWIVSQNSAGDIGGVVYLSSNKPAFYIEDTGVTWNQCITTNAITSGQWSHVAVTVTGQASRASSCTGVNIYINGVAETIVTTGSGTVNALPVTEDVFIGAKHGTSNFFNGKIDDLSIFSLKLTNAEIQSIYNEGRSRDIITGSGGGDLNTTMMEEVGVDKLAFYYTFEESSGDIINQASNIGSTDQINANLTTAGATYNTVGIRGSKDVSYSGSTGSYASFGTVTNTDFLHKGGTDYTISIWAQNDNAWANGVNSNILTSANGGANCGLIIDYRATNDVRWLAPCSGNSGGGDFNWDGGGTTNYYHFVFVYKDIANTVDLYVNGLWKARLTGVALGASASSDESLKIMGGGYGSPAAGDVDELAIYKRALTAQEIALLAESFPTQTGKFSSVATAFYEFDSDVIPIVNGGNLVYVFTSSGTFTVNSGSGNVEYLVIAGGGGAGNSGGGGAGGYKTATGYAVTAGSNYTVTIGAGGSANNKGSDSVFDTITSEGGGKGTGLNSLQAGGNGGSGGGSGGNNNDSTRYAGGTATAGQGNNGGRGCGQLSACGAGGGGGGSSAVGQDAPSNTQGGNGGAGTSSSITGTSVCRAGGGTGSHSGGTGTATCGGGSSAGASGTANTGGGGAGNYLSTGGSGGSGVVIISVPISAGMDITAKQTQVITLKNQATIENFNPTASSVWGTNADQSSETFATYTDQTDANTSWIKEDTSTKKQVDVSTDVLTANAFVDGDGDGVVYYDVTNLGNTFTVDFKLNISSWTLYTSGASAPNQYYQVSSTSGSNGSGDHLGLKVSTVADKFEISYGDGSTVNGQSVSSVFTSKPSELGTYYVRMLRPNDLTFTVSLYSDATRTTLIESKTVVITSSYTGFRYFGAYGPNENTSGNGSIYSTLDDIKIYNNFAVLGATADGTNNGATTGATGIRDEAYDFDGTNDYIVVGDTTTFRSFHGNNGAFTITGWFKQDGSNTGTDWLVATSGTSGGQDGFDISVSDGTGTYNKVAFGSQFSVTEIVPLSSATWHDNILLDSDIEWHFFAFSWEDNVQWCTWLDNNFKCGTPTDSTATSASAFPLSIGGLAGTGSFNGDIDDVNIFTTRLSSSQIQQLYNNGNSADVIDIYTGGVNGTVTSFPQLTKAAGTEKYVMSTEEPPIINDNFSSYTTTTEGDAVYVPSNTGSNEMRVNPSTDVIDGKFTANSATHATAYRNLGSVLNEQDWTIRAKVSTTSITAPTGGLSHSIYIGMSSNTSNMATTQDFLGLSMWNPGPSESPNTKKYYAVSRDGAIGGLSTGSLNTVFTTAWTSSDTYYVQISRIGITTLQVSLYSDSSYTTLIESKTLTVPATVTALQYFKVGVYDNANVVGYVFTIDDLQIIDYPIGTGKIGGGMYFDGSTYYTTATEKELIYDFEYTNPKSFSFWINPTDITVDSYIFDKTSSNVGYGMFIDASQQISFFQISSGAPNVERCKSPALTINQWSHVVFTDAGTNINCTDVGIYVNGVSTSATNTSAGTLSGTILNNVNVYIGAPANTASITQPILLDDLRFYNVELTPPEVTSLYNYNTLSGHQIVDNLVAPNNVYGYRAAGVNQNGFGAFSEYSVNAVNYTVPGAPTSLTVDSTSTTSLTLNWVAPVDDGNQPITGYKIERESPVGNGWSTLVADTGTTSTTYVNTILLSATQYNYRVSAINSVGIGNASNAYSNYTLPIAPENFVAGSATVDSITLSWDAQSGVNGYLIERESPIGGGFSVILSNYTGGIVYVDTGLNENTQYNYKISARVNPIGSSSESNATTLDGPDPPTNIIISFDPTYTDIELNWTTPVDIGSNSVITGYSIKRSINGGSFANYFNTTGTGTTYNDFGIVTNINNTYAYKIATLGDVINGTYSNSTTPIGSERPDSPISVTASLPDPDLNPYNVLLTWSASADIGTNNVITGYSISRSVNGANFTNYFNTTGTGLTYNDLSVTTGNSYAYKVATRGDIINGTYSGSSNTIVIPVVPDAPTSLTALPQSGNTSIKLDWLAPVSDGGSIITGYKIEVNINGAGWSTLVANNGVGLTYTHTGLSEQVTYQYRVSTINIIGIGSPSSVVTSEFSYAILTPTVVPSSGLVQTFKVNVNMTFGTPNTTVTDIWLKYYTSGNIVDTIDSLPYVMAKGATNLFTPMYDSPTETTEYYIQVRTTNGDTGQTKDFITSKITVIPTNFFTNQYGNLHGSEIRNSTYTGSILQLTGSPAEFDLVVVYREKNNLSNVEVFTWSGVPADVNYTNSVLEDKDYYVSAYFNPTFVYTVGGSPEDGTAIIPVGYPIDISLTSYGDPSQQEFSLGIDVIAGESGIFGLPIVFIFIIALASVFTGRSSPMGIIFVAAAIGIMAYMGMIDFNFDPANSSNLVTWSIIIIAVIVGVLIGKRWD